MSCFINSFISLWQAIIQQKSGKYLIRKDKALLKFCIPKVVSPSTTFPGIPELNLALTLPWTTLPHSLLISCRLWDLNTCCHSLFYPNVFFHIFFIFPFKKCAWPLKSIFYDTIFRSCASNNILTTVKIKLLNYKQIAFLSMPFKRCILSQRRQQPSTIARYVSSCPPHQKAAIATFRDL